MSQFNSQALREAFGVFMTGVTVVTTHDADKNPLGFTANSFTSVSLDPPLVLVCMANSSKNYEAIANASGFAVNILCEQQKEVSNTFARPVDDRFATVDWRQGPHGSPIIAGVSAWFDCSTYQQVEAGDHIVLIGKVEAFDNTGAPGLGYSRGAYVTPAMEAEVISQRTDVVVSALIEFGGDVLFQEDAKGNLCLPLDTVGKTGATATLKQLIEQTGSDAEPGFIYSVFEAVEHKQQHISFLCQAKGNRSTKGVFMPLNEETLSRVADSTLRTMLQRFARESQLGNYNVYFGDQSQGEVRPVAKGD